MSATAMPGARSSASTARDGASSDFPLRAFEPARTAHAHHRRDDAAADRMAFLQRGQRCRQHRHHPTAGSPLFAL